jgi:choice-of-anchor C domain-containing protein
MARCIFIASLVAMLSVHDVGGVPAPKIDPRTNLVVNGSFEEGVDDVGDFKPLDVGSTAIKGWKVTRGQIDYIGTFWKSADGKRSVDLHGSPGYGGISQEIATKKDQKYRVTFQAAGTPGTGERGIIVEAAGMKQTFKVDGTGHTRAEMGWSKKTWEFTATGATTLLEFRTDGTGDNQQGPAIDDVSVTIVP